MISTTSDAMIGRRISLTRYLVCALQGHFPVVITTGLNSLAAVFRTGAPHLGIMGTLAVATSSDGGCSWSDPVEICSRGLDARNPAFGVNGKGELLVVYWKAGLQAYNATEYQERLTPGAFFTSALFMSTSSDNGLTWRERTVPLPILLATASPYGRIISLDNTLIMNIYGYSRALTDRDVTISTLLLSNDDGLTWHTNRLIARDCNETALVILADGTLLAAARTNSDDHVVILGSTDMGATWSTAKRVTRNDEHPADLTMLQSGKLLLTFGKRVRPLGCGALLSNDNGKTWHTKREVLLAGDGVLNGDLGYPSTVQLADGHIVTLLYFASGSQMSKEWGTVSCQAIHYTEEDIT